MYDERKNRNELLQELDLLRQDRSRCEAFLADRQNIERALTERIKELDCLYGVTQLAQRADLPLDQLASGIANIACASWLHPECACARITIDGKGYATENFRTTRFMQSASIQVQNETVGGIDICYLEQRPEADEGPFLKEERKLLDALADLVGRIFTQRRSDEQMRALSRELIMIQETERQRIARELHDHLAQDLSIAKLGLKRIFEQDALCAATAHQGDDIMERISAAIESIRDLAYGLLPPGLSELGLVDTVLRHCEEFSRRHALTVDLYADGMQDVSLDFETQINLYRLIQEALTNTRKHAAATRVRIRMLASYPDLILSIEDDGRGADMEKCIVAAGKERRMGLWSMRERVRLLGGKIIFRSRTGEGMNIRIEVPLTRSQRERKKTNPDR
ncbi:MAG: sensor histidine kinase [Proteobacteria bacterium]|nr:sensor histidine kinase [Pseudomonadota bacterium]MBU1610641.1 sensor histidine kinase [Pseudomonadota bacterium]